MSNITLNRTPPANVRRQLRKEVNFGCPIEGCGVPYLTYHHFDPPWREKEHHDPKGIIALCPNHAAKADGGAWTKNQLKRFKKHPFISSYQIADTFSFLRNDIVCIAGCLAQGFKNFINISNETVLGFERTSQGYLGINMLLRDNDGKKILEMLENDWIVYTADIFDFECPARGKSFRIRAKDNITDFLVRSDDFSIFEFRKKMQGLGYKADQIEALLEKIRKPKKIHVLKILGTVQMGKFNIQLTETEISAESKSGHFNLKNCSLSGEPHNSLFSFNEDGTITMG